MCTRRRRPENFSPVQFSDDDTTRTDVAIFTDNTIGQYGLTNSFGEDCDTECYGLVDQCSGICNSATVMWGAEVGMSNYEVTGYPSGYAPPGAPPNFDPQGAASALGANSSQFETMALTHELGHVLRLGHSADLNQIRGICSEVQSIMYPSGSVLWGCGVTQPATGCDSSAISTVYPGAPAYCSPTEDRLCYDSAPMCQ
jgi:hypothetical protein